jgi:hypothetical protein
MVALPSREAQTVYQRFNEQVMPAIEDSDYIVAMAFDFKKVDAKLSLEVGASLLLDKKIILIVDPGVVVPAKLKSVLYGVIEAKRNDPEGMVKKIKEYVDKMEGV